VGVVPVVYLKGEVVLAQFELQLGLVLLGLWATNQNAPKACPVLMLPVLPRDAPPAPPRAHA
jgi:hypothetical protein